MVVSSETASLISSLRGFSREKLRRPDDLAVLIELSRFHHLDARLDELTFLAKFLVNTAGVMKRVGKNGEGYENLSREYAGNLEKASTIIRLIADGGPAEVKKHFSATYFAVTTEALSAMTELLYDMSWLKNWNIDHRSTAQ